MSFHMPGHNMGKEFPESFKNEIIRIDLTEIPGLENLHYPEGVIGEACDLAAKALERRRPFSL